MTEDQERFWNLLKHPYPTEKECFNCKYLKPRRNANCDGCHNYGDSGSEELWTWQYG